MISEELTDDLHVYIGLKGKVFPPKPLAMLKLFSEDIAKQEEKKGKKKRWLEQVSAPLLKLGQLLMK